MLKHYVEFLYPGVLMSESSIREVKTKAYKKLQRIPKTCFGFRFFDRQELKSNGEILKGKEKNWSGTYYFGKIYTANQVKNTFPSERILVRNIERNSPTSRGIKTRWGNWQMFERGDKVIGEK